MNKINKRQKPNKSIFKNRKKKLKIDFKIFAEQNKKLNMIKSNL